MKPARVTSAGANATHWTRPSTDKNPRIQVQLTNYGFRYAAIRRPITNAQTHDYIRLTVFVAPYTALIPPNSSYNVATVIVPKDDVSSYFHFIAWGNDDCIDQEAWRKFCVAQVGIDLDKNYRKMLRSKENDYLQDRKAMKLGDFTGVPGIPNQDIMMWESMGPIADRTSERLGASDIAIVQFRRVMIDAASKLAAGGEAIGRIEPHIPQARLASYQGIVPKSEDWRKLGASSEEIAVLGAMEQDETEAEMAGAGR